MQISGSIRIISQRATGVFHQWFEAQWSPYVPPGLTSTNSTFCPQSECIYVFCVDLRTNSDYFPIQHQLTGFYNRDGVCLLRGTD